ncbi:MAG: porin [Gemmataceae bacterium]
MPPRGSFVVPLRTCVLAAAIGLLVPSARAQTGTAPIPTTPPPVAPQEAPGEEHAPSGPLPATITHEELKKLIDQGIEEREKARKLEEAAKKTPSRKVTGTWNNGLSFETEDKAFRFAVGGVTQFDMGWYAANPALVRSLGVFNNFVDPGLALQDGMDFRRARLRMSGYAFKNIEYYAQYEFANATDLRQRTLGIDNPAGVANPLFTNIDPAETVGFNEVYIGLTEIPYLGNFRVGRHRESLNFVTATADNYQVWMERGLMFEAFNSNWNFSNGMTLANNYFNGRAYTLFGFFQQNSFSNRQFATVGDGNYVYDARVTCLPIWNEAEKEWGHVGFDYSYRNLSDNLIRFRARPDIRVGSGFQVPNIVDSGTLFSRDGAQIANLELAMARGPWTAAAEGTIAVVTNVFSGGLPAPDGSLPKGVSPRGTYLGTGAYLEVMRFLTDDHRPYVKERPGYGRVVPTRPFSWRKGDDSRWCFDKGAWEVGVRYDYVDLTHGGVNGGTSHGITTAKLVSHLERVCKGT